jgi:hypothetical protein
MSIFCQKVFLIVLYKASSSVTGRRQLDTEFVCITIVQFSCITIVRFLVFDKDFAIRFYVMQNAFRPREQTDHGLQASA